MSDDKINPITRALQQGVDTHVFPGSVLFVRCHDRICYHQAVGLTSQFPSEHPARLDTVYDLASLTKPLATGMGIVCLVQDGILDIDQPVESILPELQGRVVGQATIQDLLCHRSGLPGWRPYYEHVFLQHGVLTREVESTHRFNYLEYIAQEPLEYSPRTNSVYSDLGFILLGFVIEAVTGLPLRQYCAERMYHPLNAEPLAFFDRVGQVSDREQSSYTFAKTEQDIWRGRMLEGEVHDENAYVLGGAAGHAGLFGTAEAVSVVTKAWLDSYLGGGMFFDPKLVRQFTARQGEPQDSSWALGWDTPSSPSSSGSHFSSSAFGHLGFTGTSIWIDPEVELEVILLTNRVHPTRKNNKIRQFRPMIHDVIYTEVIGR
ncbi:MAG: serine hydrolase domain-containing protein [Nitrospirales bacterium]